MLYPFPIDVAHLGPHVLEEDVPESHARVAADCLPFTKDNVEAGGVLLDDGLDLGVLLASAQVTLPRDTGTNTKEASEYVYVHVYVVVAWRWEVWASPQL